MLAACGAAVLAGLAAPVSATPGDLHQDRRPVVSLAGLPFPDRAVARYPAAPGSAPARCGTPPRRTPTWSSYDPETRSGTWPAPTSAPAPTPRPMDARWREIYQLNRAVIGPDPDLIQPAQRLRLPAQQR